MHPPGCSWILRRRLLAMRRWTRECPTSDTAPDAKQKTVATASAASISVTAATGSISIAAGSSLPTVHPAPSIDRTTPKTTQPTATAVLASLSWASAASTTQHTATLAPTMPTTQHTPTLAPAMHTSPVASRVASRIASRVAWVC